MRTRDEVVHAFTPVGKLSEQQKMYLLHIESSFKNVATDILEYVPESADRTAALRKLLEAKFTCSQAITHMKGEDDVEEKDASPKGSKKNTKTKA